MRNASTGCGVFATSDHPGIKGLAAGLAVGALLLSGLASTSALAAQGDSWTDQLIDGIAEGDFDVNFRYRYEYVDWKATEKDANASTLRSRLLY